MPVPYSILPAQFLSFSAAAQAKAREAEGTAIAAVMSFMKVLLFIARFPGADLIHGDNPTIFFAAQEVRLDGRYFLNG